MSTSTITFTETELVLIDDALRYYNLASSEFSAKRKVALDAREKIRAALSLIWDREETETK